MGKRNIGRIVRIGAAAAAMAAFICFCRYGSRQARYQELYEKARLHLIANNPLAAIDKLEEIAAEDSGYQDTEVLLAYMRAYEGACEKMDRDEILSLLDQIPEDYDGDMAERITAFSEWIRENYDGHSILTGCDSVIVDSIPEGILSGTDQETKEAIEQLWVADAETVIAYLTDSSYQEEYTQEGYLGAEAVSSSYYEFNPALYTYRRYDRYDVTVLFAADSPCANDANLLCDCFMDVQDDMTDDIGVPRIIAERNGTIEDYTVCWADHKVYSWGTEIHVTFQCGDETYYFPDHAEYRAMTGESYPSAQGLLYYDAPVLINGELCSVTLKNKNFYYGESSGSVSGSSSSGQSSSSGKNAYSGKNSGIYDPDDYDDPDDYADDAWDNEYEDWEEAYDAWEDN